MLLLTLIGTGLGGCVAYLLGPLLCLRLFVGQAGGALLTTYAGPNPRYPRLSTFASSMLPAFLCHVAESLWSGTAAPAVQGMAALFFSGLFYYRFFSDKKSVSFQLGHLALLQFIYFLMQGCLACLTFLNQHQQHRNTFYQNITQLHEVTDFRITQPNSAFTDISTWLLDASHLTAFEYRNTSSALFHAVNCTARYGVGNVCNEEILPARLTTREGSGLTF